MFHDTFYGWSSDTEILVHSSRNLINSTRNPPLLLPNDKQQDVEPGKIYARTNKRMSRLSLTNSFQSIVPPLINQRGSHAMIQQTVGLREGLLTIVKTQTEVVWTCLPFIRSGQNHLARQSKRGRRQGRQKKRWEDNIKEWTGLNFAKSQRAVENREKWRKLVVKLPVVPQRSSRLWDRWRRWRWRSASPLYTYQHFSLQYGVPQTTCKRT